MRTTIICVIMGIAWALTSCSRLDNSTRDRASAGGVGTVHLEVTDSPFPISYVSSASISVSRIELRKKSGNFIVLSDSESSFDLVSLRNGITQALATMKIPAGAYDQIRLVVSKAQVSLTDSRMFSLVVPSGAASGLKIDVSPALQVADGVSSDLLLDFDLSKSFVPQGDSNSVSGITGFHFSPVLRASNLSTAGTLCGYIYADNSTPSNSADDFALAGAQVEISQNGAVISTALTDSYGYFKVLGLPAGNYQVLASQSGYADSDQQNASVLAGSKTDLNITLSEVPATPPAVQ